MKKLLVPALWLALVVTIAYSVKEAVRAIRETVQFEQDTTRLFTQVEVDRIARDSMAAENARSQRTVDSLLGVANRKALGRLAALREADSLQTLLDSSVSESDSLVYAILRAERLEGALGEATTEIVSLRSIVASQALSLSRLTVDNKTAWADIDSLQALIRRVPTCRKIPFWGISVPKLGIGYFATTGGHGIGVGVVVPLGKC